MNKNNHICRMITIDKKIYNLLPNVETTIPKTIFDGSYNKSFLFLLPLTGFEKHKFENEFVHCFYDSISKPINIANAFYIMCKPSKEVHEHIKSLPGYLYNYCAGILDDQKYTLYCILIENPDYFKIIKGKYSTISKETKKIILDYKYFLNQERTDLFKTNMDGVLNKRSWYKNKLEKKLEISLGGREYKSKFDSNLNKEIYLYDK